MMGLKPRKLKADVALGDLLFTPSTQHRITFLEADLQPSLKKCNMDEEYFSTADSFYHYSNSVEPIIRN